MTAQLAPLPFTCYKNRQYPSTTIQEKDTRLTCRVAEYGALQKRKKYENYGLSSSYCNSCSFAVWYVSFDSSARITPTVQPDSPRLFSLNHGKVFLPHLVRTVDFSRRHDALSINNLLLKLWQSTYNPFTYQLLQMADVFCQFPHSFALSMWIVIGPVFFCFIKITAAAVQLLFWTIEFFGPIAFI